MNRLTRRCRITIMLALISVMYAGIGMFAGDALSAETEKGVAWGDGNVVAVDDENVEARRVTRRQAREIGITTNRMLPVLRQIKADGRVDLDDREAVAEAVLAGMLDDSGPKLGGPKPSEVDWGAILDFIERLIPLLLKLIALFG